MTSTRITGGHGFRRRRSVRVAAAAVAALAIAAAVSAFHQPLREIDPTAEDAVERGRGHRDHRHPHVRAARGPAHRRRPRVRRRRRRHPAHARRVPPGGRRRDRRSLPTVVSVHGGSWARGDKANADWRKVCLWLASEGFVAASVNYRLVPDARFPAQIDDVALAVEWLREPEQVERFGIDPARIAAFGGSAGGQPRVAPRHARRRAARRGFASRRGGRALGPVGLGLGRARRGRRLAVARGIVGEYLACEPGAGIDACPQATDASADGAGRPERPAVLHRPRGAGGRAGRAVGAVRRDARRAGGAGRAGVVPATRTRSASSTGRSGRGSPRSCTHTSADRSRQPLTRRPRRRS